ILISLPSCVRAVTPPSGHGDPTAPASSLFFTRHGDHRDLHSFPTRRSSDLRFGGMKTYNWEGVNPDGYFLDKLEPIPSALPSFQKLFQVSATALSIP